VHTTEVERLGDDIAGIGVHIGARVTAAATAGEVCVTRTVRDLVAGSGLRFEPRGTHAFKGISEPWDVHAAVLEPPTDEEVSA
jgi:class 3 adenylate cyclase